MAKWTCFICGEVVQKFSLVVSHVEKHKHDEQKSNSLLEAIYEDWRCEKSKPSILGSRHSSSSILDRLVTGFIFFIAQQILDFKVTEFVLAFEFFSRVEVFSNSILRNFIFIR